MSQVQYEVALSGLTRRSQVLELARLLEQRPINTQVILGFSTGYHLPTDSELTRRSNLYVPLAAVAKLPAEVSAYYQAHFTPNLKIGVPVAEQVRALYLWSGSWLNSVQINTPQVTPQELHQIAELDPNREVVYPLGRSRMRRILHDFTRSSVWLRNLEDAGVATLLLDNSAGYGPPLSYREVAGCLESLQNSTTLKVRIAGRLGESQLDKLERVERLLQNYPTTSFGWEVESRLRDEQDRFDIARARQYLAESFALIEQLR